MASLLHSASAEQRVAAVREGLPYTLFTALATELGVSTTELARVIRVPLRTLQRRGESGAFPPAESDRLFRIVRLTERAKEVLGEAAAAWLTTPKRFLNGETPLGFSDTETGAWEVMQALGRLEHGVFL